MKIGLAGSGSGRESGEEGVWMGSKAGSSYKWDRAERPFVCMRLGFRAFLSTRAPNQRALDMTRHVGCFLLTLQYLSIAVSE